MQAILASTTTHAIRVSDLIELEGGPRVRDLRLAEVLQMTDLHSVRRLIQKYAGTLRAFGELVSEHDRKLPQGGRPGKSYYLNRRQAIFITAKSDTPRAAIMTVQMVEVFDAYLAGKTVPACAHSRSLPVPKPQIDLAPGRYVIRVDDEGRVASTERLKRDVLLLDAAQWAEFHAAMPMPRSFH